MANAKRNMFAFNLLALIPGLVKLAESWGGSGSEKKAAVKDVLTGLVVAGGQAVAINNPHYGDLVGQVIDATVAHFNTTGDLPLPVVGP